MPSLCYQSRARNCLPAKTLSDVIHRLGELLISLGNLIEKGYLPARRFRLQIACINADKPHRHTLADQAFQESQGYGEDLFGRIRWTA